MTTTATPTNGTNPMVVNPATTTTAAMSTRTNHTTQILSSEHSDYVHHIAFDVYGRRMATCSGDRFVRIWDLTENGDWTLAAEWQAHRGSISQLKWAHPEFGPLLATAGADHDAKIWEEREPASVATTSSGLAPGVGGVGVPNSTTPTAAVDLVNGMPSTGSSGGSRWVNKASLTEARRAVTCLEFAPRQWGLKLATGSADGMIRIYEAVDIMNLAQWPLQATLSAFSSEGDLSPQQNTPPPLGVTCLSWCTGRFEPPTLIVGGSHLAIYRYSDASRQWQSLLTLTSPSNNPNVLDVAWAPNVGRRYHLIASVDDHKLTVYRLARNTVTSSSTTTTTTARTNGDGGGGAPNKPDYQLELESSQILEDDSMDSYQEGSGSGGGEQQPPQQVWRCQWNVTGTVLASSGDGGRVQLWKSDFEGKWKCVSQMYGDLSATMP
mmetsp:Transcript_1727/g.2390  ORF Transcript_1727/g.2390 Transcript_1727/m.2390 type:complete len:437 (+) Transcript_1727:135-1445(+)